MARERNCSAVKVQVKQADTDAQSNITENGKRIYMVKAIMYEKLARAHKAEDGREWGDNVREDDVRGEGAVRRRAGAAVQQTRWQTALIFKPDARSNRKPLMGHCYNPSSICTEPQAAQLITIIGRTHTHPCT